MTPRQRGARDGGASAVDAQPCKAWLRLETGQHTGPVRQMRLSADGRTLVTAGDCTLRVWDARTRQALRVLRGQIGAEVDDTPGHGQVLRFAISRDSDSVVALKSWRADAADPRSALTTELQVFALATGNLVAAFNHPGRWVDLDFSPDGRWLVVAGCGPRARATLQAYAWADVLRAGFGRAPAEAGSAAFGGCAADENQPVAAGFVPGAQRRGSDAVLVVATNPTHRGGRVAGRLCWATLSPRGQLNTQHSTLADGPIVPSTLALSTAYAAVAGRMGPGKPQGQLLCHDHEGKRVAAHATESPPSALAFSTTGGRLLVGLCARRPNAGTVQVSVFNTAGGTFRVKSSYYGHDDTVAAVAFCADGTAVSSGGDHQALHFWSPAHRMGEALTLLRGVGRTPWSAGIDVNDQIGFGTVPGRQLPIGHPKRQQCFDLKTLTLRAANAGEIGNFQRPSKKWSLGTGAPGLRIALHCRADDGDAASSPDLTLFVGTDDEWVVFSRSGFYDASAQGDQHFGYHINRGAGREALFLPSDRFKALFYRRDLIKAVVKHGSEARARAEGVAIPEVDVTTVLPPTVELSSGPVVRGRHVTLRFKVESLRPDHNPLQRVWMLQNGVFGWEAPTLSSHGEYTVKRPLRPGPNTFTLFAKGPGSVSLPVTHTVQGPTGGSGTVGKGLKTGNLYLLCVGVSRFAAEDDAAKQGFKPLKYAHKDATAVFNALGKSRFSSRVDERVRPVNKAFKAVHAKLLLNEQATKSAVLGELQAMCAQIQARDETHPAERDVLFIFLAGHGVRPKGTDQLFFWNHDLDLKKGLGETGLSLTELGGIATAVPGELVIAIDACHSGLSGSNTLAGVNAEELARRIHAVNERGIYIMNAARDDQDAIEHDELGHGIFTFALLTALRDEKSLVAEATGNAQSALSMMGLIAAVQELVSYKARRKQTSVFRTYGDLLPLTIYKR
jgi:uncharacterized caspase-like protein/WD40 repeat protein